MSGLVGIDQETDSVGFERIVIRPAMPPGLSRAMASYDSIRGRIESEWALEDGVLNVRVNIPANSTARIFIPSVFPGAVQETGIPAADTSGVTAVEQADGCCIISVGSGEYHFQVNAQE